MGKPRKKCRGALGLLGIGWLALVGCGGSQPAGGGTAGTAAASETGAASAETGAAGTMTPGTETGEASTSGATTGSADDDTGTGPMSDCDPTTPLEPGTLPQWVQDLPVGAWAEIPNTAFAQSPALFDWGPDGPIPTGAVDGWGGWAHYPDTQQIWLGGGGHSDYQGNEFYRLDLAADTLEYKRCNDPTPDEDLTRFVTHPEHGVIHTKWNADGTPVAAHMYWSLQYLQGKLVFTNYYADFGATEPGMHAFAPDNESFIPVFDTETNSYGAPDSHPVTPGFYADDPASGGVGYHPCVTDGTYYYVVMIDREAGYNRLSRYDPVANIWEGVGPDIGTHPINATFAGAIYDSLRREIVQIGEDTDDIIVRINLDTGLLTTVPKSGVAFGAGWDSSYSGVTYDSMRDLYYLYSGQATTDKNLYVIDPANDYEASIMNEIGTPEPTVIPAGLNSRFKYIAAYDLVLMQPHSLSNLVALRLGDCARR